MADAAPPAARKRSGRNIKEAQRATVAVKLRLPPEIADAIDAMAARWRVTRSGAVARLVERAEE